MAHCVDRETWRKAGRTLLLLVEAAKGKERWPEVDKEYLILAP